MSEAYAQLALQHYRTEKALREEVERLRIQCGGNCRYWEGRWRDEAKENERLKEALTNALLALDERNNDAEILARTYEKQIERLLKELERANCPVVDARNSDD